jgi:hypothetical protein
VGLYTHKIFDDLLQTHGHSRGYFVEALLQRTLFVSPPVSLLNLC